MTHDDIIRMAKEAGFELDCCSLEWHSRIERFAALVAAAEREAIIALVMPSEEHRRDASWGYLGGTEGVELLDEIVEQIRAKAA